MATAPLGRSMEAVDRAAGDAGEEAGGVFTTAQTLHRATATFGAPLTFMLDSGPHRARCCATVLCRAVDSAPLMSRRGTRPRIFQDAGVVSVIWRAGPEIGGRESHVP